MTTCEQCGADAVNAQGICANCGWQAPDAAHESDDSPSLGDTRAADFAMPGGTPESQPTRTPPPRSSRTSEMPYPGRPARTSGPTAGNGMGTTAGTARYCGTCGARIATGEAFCGQCGTPVGASGGDYGTVNMSAGPASRYQVGGTGWTGASGDAPTEEFIAPPPSTYPHTPPGAGYMPPTYASGQNMPPMAGAAQTGSGRTVRIVFGILCLAGSIGSAIAAVVLAVQPPK